MKSEVTEKVDEINARLQISDPDAVSAPLARSRNRTQAQSPVPTNSTEDMPSDH